MSEWKLVPVEPTDEQLAQLWRELNFKIAPGFDREAVRHVYHTILRDAPVPPAASAGLVEAVRFALDRFMPFRENYVFSKRHALDKLSSALHAHDAASEQPAPAEGCKQHAPLSEHATLQPAPVDELPDDWQTELLDWVSACQSAYHIDSTPGHRFGGLGSNLEENRTAVVDYVADLVARAAVAADRAGLVLTAEEEGEAYCVFVSKAKSRNGMHYVPTLWETWQARAAMKGQS
jgi:hypothetical protein